MWSSTRWQNYFFPNISRHFMNFSVSSSRTSASTHARKYSDPKQPSRENIQRKKQTETKSCVELRVRFRWRWLPRSPAADDGVLLSRWSQLILLMVLILQSQQNKRNVTKTIQLHKNRSHYVRVDVGGAGAQEMLRRGRERFVVMMIRWDGFEIGSLLLRRFLGLDFLFLI